MELVLDCRERDLYNACTSLIKTNENFKDIKLSSKNLELGDIIIKDSDKELLIIERKSISDLVASIKDGRYTEQSFRLNALEHHNHNIIYLIEGSVGKYTEKQMVFSAMFSMNYYKGFSVFRSFNLDETAYIVCNAALKMKKEKTKDPFYKNSEVSQLSSEICDEEKEEPKYCSVIKKQKNANITPDNFGEIVLCQIPSVNSVTAIAIMKEYKTINNLIEKLKENSECLNNITYQTDKKQTRKISKTCIKNIVTFLNL
jgi:ERCC4-type nuclease